MLAKRSCDPNATDVISHSHTHFHKTL